MSRSPISTRALLAVAVIAVVVVVPSAALAWDEIRRAYPPMDFSGYCYPECHDNADGIFNGTGPHGNYTTTSGKCDNGQDNVRRGRGRKHQAAPCSDHPGNVFHMSRRIWWSRSRGVIAARGLAVEERVTVWISPIRSQAATVSREERLPECSTARTPSSHVNGPPQSPRCRYRRTLPRRADSQRADGVAVHDEQVAQADSHRRQRGGRDVRVGLVSCRYKGPEQSGFVHNHPVETTTSAAPWRARHAATACRCSTVTHRRRQRF